MEKVDDEENKKLLRMLAEMEDEHEKIFAAMRAELTADEKAATVFDPEDDSFLYLRALADTRVFFEKEIDVSSTVEILKSAIQAEGAMYVPDAALFSKKWWIKNDTMSVVLQSPTSGRARASMSST